ncbi:hypothetical protein F5884DRAFT_759603 [Xylogone sp. PMI_703]|nr:hypothetical protein F5884DRAFT_759603 [Xylogone sp. PMI_703]
MNDNTKSVAPLSVDDGFIGQEISEQVDRMREELFDINQKIYDNPELCYQETKAHDNIVLLLLSHDITTQSHAYAVPTAFLAEYGSGGRLVTFCAEYDALPGIGHACGHNLIATASVAAFFGLMAALKASAIPGRVRLLGTPAEEGGGGKIKLIEAGAFDDTDAALMIHPLPSLPNGISGSSYSTCLAISHFGATLKGKAAHAGMAPWAGVNALDAATLAYTALGMLRQHIKPTERINVITRTDETAKENVIADRAKIECAVRARTLQELQALKDRALKCIEGAAIATGCSVDYDKSHAAYADLRPNEILAKEFTQAMKAYGLDFNLDLKKERTTRSL